MKYLQSADEGHDVWFLVSPPPPSCGRPYIKLTHGESIDKGDKIHRTGKLSYAAHLYCILGVGIFWYLTIRINSWGHESIVSRFLAIFNPPNFLKINK